MTIGDRIKLVRGSESQDSFAAKIGINKASLGFYERNERAPKATTIGRIATLCGYNTRWLILGEGPAKMGEDPMSASGGDTLSISHESAPRQPVAMGCRVVPFAKPEVIECMDCHLTMIPMVEARLAAGTGSFETGGETERRYAFRTDFLSRKGQISQMVLMRVEGDSMEPKIESGDTVLIDQSQTQPRPGGMYAVGVEDMVYIKMVDALPGKIILKSLNPAYAPLEIDTRGDLADGIRILGKAIWIGREMR